MTSQTVAYCGNMIVYKGYSLCHSGSCYNLLCILWRGLQYSERIYLVLCAQTSRGKHSRVLGIYSLSKWHSALYVANLYPLFVIISLSLPS